MKKTLFTLVTLLGVGLLFSSCTKTVHDGGDSQALTSLFTVTPSEWLTNQGGGFVVTLPTDELSKDITDVGGVFVYLSTDGGNNYENFPSNANMGYNFIATHGDFNVTIFAFNTDNSTAAPNFNLKIKVVSIPSGLITANKNVDFKNYNQVKRAFKLQ